MTASTRRAALGAILAAPLTGGAVMALPSKGVQVGHPSDLARACDWAVQHREWIDKIACRSPMSDNEIGIEAGKVDAVITRAIVEPSVSLRDLRAKAALALEDYERFTAVPGSTMDDGERIVLTVLREVITLCA